MVDPRPSPRGTEFSDPLSETVEAWLNDFAKAAKGMRVYAENNEMLQKYVDRAFTGLTQLLTRDPELDLSIREDRILYGKDAVHINSDREEGLPFVFYRNAFRRITLVQGMPREELFALLKAIVTDYKSFNNVQDDLVTTLWKLSLPHLRYLTIDAITAKAKSATGVEREEIERIQGSVENIVAAIYKTDTADDDIVAGVSITKEDLEALKDIRKESDEDLDMLDQATERAITDVSPKDIEFIKKSLEADDRDDLTNRMLDILVRMLFKETSSRESAQTIEVLQRLFDALVLAQQYAHATSLIERLRNVAEHAENMQEMHISRHLLRMFAAESRVLTVLNALNEGYSTASASDKIRFLQALGEPIVGPLLTSLEVVTSPAHRRALCEIIGQLGVPDITKLMEVCEHAKWFVVRDLLALAQKLPPQRISILIKQSLAHPHPKVRAYAVGMLRGYARGMADTLIVACLEDEDLDVRVAAIRVAAARRSTPALTALEKYLSVEDLSDREPRELRMAMTAYASIGRKDAVPLLDRILNPGFFAGLKSSEPQVAAAVALGSIGQDGADALTRGGRSLNSKVREACKRALAAVAKSEAKKGEANQDETPVPKADATPSPRGIDGIPSEASDPHGSITAILRDFNAESSDIQVSPFAGNTGDVEYTVEKGGEVDELENAPPFYLYDPTVDIPEEPREAPNTPLFQARPEMPAVNRPYHEPDHIPQNLPPAPADKVRVGGTDDVEALRAGLSSAAGSTPVPSDETMTEHGARVAPPEPEPPPRMPPPSAAGVREELPPMAPPPSAPPPPAPEPAPPPRMPPPSAAGVREELPPMAPPSAAGAREELPPMAPPSAAGAREELPPMAPPSAAGMREELPPMAPPSAAGMREELPPMAPPSAAGAREAFPPMPHHASAGTSDEFETMAPPSAAGVREVLPPMPAAAPPEPPPSQVEDIPIGAPVYSDNPEGSPVPEWVNETFSSMDVTQQAIPSQPAPPAPPAPTAPAPSGEMKLDIGELTDRSLGRPPPGPVPTQPAPSGEMKLDIGELSDRSEEEHPGFDDDDEDSSVGGPSVDDIPSADDVVASLFGDAPMASDGDQPLQANHETGDIVKEDSSDGLDAPYIPAVDSDPFATANGEPPPPPPKSETWSSSSDSEKPKQTLPWVDDLVLDDDPNRGGAG